VRHAGPLRAGEGGRARPVAADGDDFGAVRRLGCCVEQGLEGAAVPRGENDQAGRQGVLQEVQ